MSHYSVAVIVPKTIGEEEIRCYIDNQMSPFNESIEVEPYIRYTKDELLKMYAEYKEKPWYDGIMSFEEYSDDYAGGGNDEEGNALSTYNPNSKWDWYEIGGRWSNEINTKQGEHVNFARIKDINFNATFNEDELKELSERYNKLITEGDFYKPEYYKERYKTFEDYLKSYDFSTYALLDTNGVWHEPGQMGWFGMSSASPEELTNFDDEYMEIIKSQDEENWLVIVDCHI